MLRSEFARNALTLISGTSFAQGIAIVVYLILPAIYTPEDFGLLALYMSILSITMIISTGRYEISIMLPDNEEDAKRLLELSLIISAGVSLLLLIAVLLFRMPFAILLGNESIAPWLYFIPLSTFMVGGFQTFRYFNNRGKRYRTITAANVGQSFTNSFAKLGIGPLVEGPAGLVAGTLIGQFTGFIIFLFRSVKNGLGIFRNPDFHRVRELAGEYSLFPRFNMFQALVNNLSGVLPIFVFTSWFSAGIAGYFSLGYTIVYKPVNLVTSAFFQVLFQNISEKHKKGKRIYPDIRKFLLRMIRLVIIPFVALLFLAPQIFRIFPAEWEEAGRYTQIMVPWLFMVSLIMPLSFIPDMFKRQKTAFVIDLVKFLLRTAALAAGVIKQDIYLALVLFSGSSAFVILYTLLWYVRLVRRSDSIREP